MTQPTTRPAMRPETLSAQNRYLNAIRLADGSADAQAHIEATRRAYYDLGATDPHCILADADEQDAMAASARDDWFANVCREKAASLRAKAEAIMADEYPFVADMAEAA